MIWHYYIKFYFWYLFKATKYIVCVYTGDVRGGGTDASVFITIFGDKGDTGERKLFNSETYKNKFERNQVSTIVDIILWNKMFILIC